MTFWMFAAGLLLLIAAGTSLPELVTSVIATVRVVTVRTIRSRKKAGKK